jgi:hypothetical protein
LAAASSNGTNAATTPFAYDFDVPKAPEYFRQAFVMDLLALLTEKLHTFWKISQNFAVTGQAAAAVMATGSLAEASELQERQMDIDVRKNVFCL